MSERDSRNEILSRGLWGVIGAFVFGVLAYVMSAGHSGFVAAGAASGFVLGALFRDTFLHIAWWM